MNKIKSLSIILLALAMLLSFAACGGKTTDETTAAEDTTVTDETTAADEETTEGKTAGDTLGDTLAAAFNEACKDNDTAEAIAAKISENEAIEFSPAMMPVEEGLLNGFDNEEIKGFKAGTMLAPMIGSIPFVSYVFELEDGTDAAAFTETLRNAANPRWNICTEADQTLIETNGNFVFFIMCPTTLAE